MMDNHNHHQADPVNVTHLFHEAVVNVLNVTTTTIVPIIKATVNQHLHHQHVHEEVNASAAPTMDAHAHPLPPPHQHPVDVVQDHSAHTSGHSMKMYFNLDTTGIIVLFDFWKIDTPLSLFISIFILFALAVAYEGLKIGREILLNRCQTNCLSRRSRNKGKGERSDVFLLNVCNQDEQIKVVAECDCGTCSTCTNVNIYSSSNRYWSTVGHVIQSLLHIVQIVLSYCLMLVFMTYNVWLCAAVSLGAGVGYFAFAWRRKTFVDTNEHCN